jgi:hypothetical protein
MSPIPSMAKRVGKYWTGLFEPTGAISRLLEFSEQGAIGPARFVSVKHDRRFYRATSAQ